MNPAKSRGVAAADAGEGGAAVTAYSVTFNPRQRDLVATDRNVLLKTEFRGTSAEVRGADVSLCQDPSSLYGSCRVAFLTASHFSSSAFQASFPSPVPSSGFLPW